MSNTKSIHFRPSHPALSNPLSLSLFVFLSVFVSICLSLSLMFLSLFLSVSTRFAVIASGCASCPRLVCRREGCGAEFCYHCKQAWHPNQTCDSARQQRALSLHTHSNHSPSYTQEQGPGEYTPTHAHTLVPSLFLYQCLFLSLSQSLRRTHRHTVFDFSLSVTASCSKLPLYIVLVFQLITVICARINHSRVVTHTCLRTVRKKSSRNQEIKTVTVK